MSNASLYDPIAIGDLTLSNRIVMAPMTRNRADEQLAPPPMAVKYYSQRASAGLIITEASQVSPDGVGYPATPGIYTDEQVTCWRRVTDAVHKEGGHIFIQLWYCGRISHLACYRTTPRRWRRPPLPRKVMHLRMKACNRL